MTGALVLYLFSRRRLIGPIDFLDIAAPSVMIAQSIGRWETSLTRKLMELLLKVSTTRPSLFGDQMYIDGSYRQPTFLYESSWNLLGFLLILILRRKPQFCGKVRSQPFTLSGMVLVG